ncbi:hypothetical protein [Caulobacter sp. S45]|uniref:hypothetical protein n=1 Tax=Caulobacter sp. S45 TaxID=1641861 RepID=UPI00131DC460|nr:hypothetical protein [Caulobacter sp. S45]
MSDNPDTVPGAMRRMVGGLLLSAGILIVGLCGLCTLSMGNQILTGLIFSSIPIIVGLLLVRTGLRQIGPIPIGQKNPLHLPPEDGSERPGGSTATFVVGSGMCSLATAWIAFVLFKSISQGERISRLNNSIHNYPLVTSIATLLIIGMAGIVAGAIAFMAGMRLLRGARV